MFLFFIRVFGCSAVLLFSIVTNWNVKADMTLRVVDRSWEKMVKVVPRLSRGRTVFLIQGPLDADKTKELLSHSAKTIKGSLLVFLISTKSSNLKFFSFTGEEMTFNADLRASSELSGIAGSSARKGNAILQRRANGGEIIKVHPIFTAVKPAHQKHCTDEGPKIELIFYVDDRTPINLDKINIVDPSELISQFYSECHSAETVDLAVFNKTIEKRPILTLRVNRKTTALFETATVYLDPVANVYLDRGHFSTALERDLVYRHFEVNAQSGKIDLRRQLLREEIKHTRAIIKLLGEKVEMAGLASDKKELRSEQRLLAESETKLADFDQLSQLFSNLSKKYTSRIEACLGTMLKTGYNVSRPASTSLYEDMYKKLGSVEKVRTFYERNQIGVKCL